ncbi:MAG: hypothetical protein C4297_06740 [Gemmataceae bacterium]
MSALRFLPSPGRNGLTLRIYSPVHQVAGFCARLEELYPFSARRAPAASGKKLAGGSFLSSAAAVSGDT